MVLDSGSFLKKALLDQHIKNILTLKLNNFVKMFEKWKLCLMKTEIKIFKHSVDSIVVIHVHAYT